MQEQRPTVEPTRNPDSGPTPTPNSTPTPTPKAEGKPPRKRGVITEQLRKVKETRHKLAQHRWPGISHDEAQRVCVHRRDRMEHPVTLRGRERTQVMPASELAPDSLAARCLEQFGERANTTYLARAFGVSTKEITKAFQQLASHGLIERETRHWWTRVEVAEAVEAEVTYG